MNLPINNKGFSLIEIVLVVIIIGFVVALVINLPNSARLISQSQYKTKADNAASKKIEGLRAQGFTSLCPGDNCPGGGPQSCTDCDISFLPGAAASYEIKNCLTPICSNNEKAAEAVVTISWSEGGQVRNTTLHTIITEGGIK